jgi:uncharacterized SAM-binding protein YcdF (DUF218 family)
VKSSLGKRVVVVLGGGLHADGSPWDATRLRAQAGARLALADPDMTVILSGAGARIVRDRNAPTEAAVMAQLVLEDGVGRNRLFIEPESIDTVGNAILSSARFLYGKKPRPITVVTSPFHAVRAGIAFRGVLGPAWSVVVHTADPATDDTERTAGELGGIGWMNRFFESVTPGDLPGIVQHLFEVGKPYYRDLPILSRLAHKAA